MANPEAKTMLSEVITIIGQIQYSLSLRRRYQIRAALKKKSANICNMNIPIISFLFGDNVAKDIKACDDGVSLAKEKYGYHNQQSRDRGNWRYKRGQTRYNPYSQSSGKHVNYQRPKSKTATSTVTMNTPNGNAV
ncbi:hypothetical protein ACF0H5_024233 [Mactra antiquata]